MEMNMYKRLDIFDYLGVSGKEDAYTDLLANVFDVSDEFKINLSNKLFGIKSNNIFLKIRSCYETPEGKSSKIIPDMLFYNSDNFAIIEVKIFAEEGWEQINRYRSGFEVIQEKLIKEDVDKIIDIEKFKENKDRRNVFFLTLSGTIKEGAISLKWKDMVDLIPDDVGDERLNICIMDLRNRIAEYESPAVDYNELFYKQFDTMHFVSADRILKIIFNKSEPFNNYILEFWSKWENGQNRYSSNIQVYKNEWQSDCIIEEKQGVVLNKDSIHVANNYDVHFEIKFYWKEKWWAEFRIDYHINPYKSENEIDELGINYIYEERKKIIDKVLDDNKCNKFKEFFYRYGGKGFGIYRHYIEIKENQSVCDVKKLIIDEMKETLPVIECLMKAIKT